MTGNRVPVLIVGAGAGGLSASALLAKHGVRSLVVEKRREVFLYPKARNLSFRSLEILRGLGLADEVHAVAEGVSDMLTKASLTSTQAQPAFDVDAIFAPFGGLSPEPAAQYCPQSALEPMLLEHIRGQGGEVRYGTELCSLEQDDTGVTAVVRDRDTGGAEVVRADYLIAADGVHSPARDALGIPTSGHGALPIYVVFIYFRGPWRQFVPQLGDGDAIQVANDEVDGIFLPVRDDFGMFLTTYLPGRGETAAQFTADHCHRLLTKAIGEHIDMEIVEVTPWQPYELVADWFRCGRVFLVGDSAHAMPPFKAGGANCAIQSAHNLAWKLAAVSAGMADPALLDTYHTERHPVGCFSARQSLTGPVLPLLRLDDTGPGLSAGEEAPMFALLIGYRYRSAAVLSDDPAPSDPSAVSLVSDLCGQPGTRVPHVWLTHGGQRLSTLDLLGPGFTVLTGSDGGRWRAAAAQTSEVLGIPLVAHRIADEGWARTTGLAPDGALLIRPDDFVGWRADGLPANPDSELQRALSTILARS
ncbi:FAD-dependent monooxygenase [Mycolicibacter heraklionensis]|uniref:FAD-dependent monooxygenase n=1 Tax=Mycolicibacter heraklionensis TaxID=512402 RepID=A0A9X7WJF7_9MYCO|nr:FAD-dependent monooxygenase [Mycolicibacter heraklionensis]QZA09360.1 FAD-dependent monooxygenase [Mycolicibacter heraklionensis]